MAQIKMGTAANFLKFGARAHDLVESPRETEERLNFETAREFARKLRLVALDSKLKCVQLALKKSLPNFGNFNQMDSEDIGKLAKIFKEELVEKGIEIAVMGNYHNILANSFSNDQNGEAQTSKMSEFPESDFCQYVENAPQFSSSIVGTEPGSILPQGGFSIDNFTEETFEKVVLKVREFCDHAQKVYEGSSQGNSQGNSQAGRVFVGIEPGLNHPIFSVESTKQLINAVESDFLKIIFDPFNYITKETADEFGEIIDRSFREFGEHICAVHLKDFVIENKFNFQNGEMGVKPVSIGKGVLDFKKTVEQIHSFNPDLPIIFEHSSPSDIKNALSV